MERLRAEQGTLAPRFDTTHQAVLFTRARFKHRIAPLLISPFVFLTYPPFRICQALFRPPLAATT